MASAMVWICQILTLRSLLTSHSSRTESGSPVEISLCTFPFLNIFYLLWFSNPIPSTTQLAEVKLLESHRSLCKHKSDAVLCLRPPWLLSDTDEQTAKFSNKQNVDSVTHLAATEYNEFSICSTCKQLGWCSFSLNRKPFYNVNSGQESRKESPLQRFANPPVEYGFKYNLYWPRQLILNIWYCTYLFSTLHLSLLLLFTRNFHDKESCHLEQWILGNVNILPIPPCVLNPSTRVIFGRNTD